jgi:hypothetical protein
LVEWTTTNSPNDARSDEDEADVDSNHMQNQTNDVQVNNYHKQTCSRTIRSSLVGVGAATKGYCGFIN